MKGRSLILIFLFLILLVQPVVAVDDYFHWTGTSSDIVTQTTQFADTGITHNNYLHLNNVGITSGFSSMTFTAPTISTSVSGGDGIEAWDTYVTFRKDNGSGEVVGTGIYGYKLVGADYEISVYVWQLDICDEVGSLDLFIGDSYITTGPKVGTVKYTTAWDDTIADHVVLKYKNGAGTARYLKGSTTETLVHYNYFNTYFYDWYPSHYFLEVNRTSSNQSKIIIDINGIEVINETSLSSTDFQHLDGNLSNVTWDITIENIHGDIKTKQLTFSETFPNHYASIIFNQSYFHSPKVVGVEYNIEYFDSTNYEYWILVIGTNGGTEYIVSNEYYDITTATGQDNFTISYSPLALPFTMQAELWTYSKLSGESSVLATSSEVPYNPASQAPGQIWTEKSNYNISEMFYIEFDTNFNTVQIELISDTFHDLRTMEGPGVGHLGYLFNTPHDFTAYLIEDGIRTNHTDFTVSADNPFLNIYLDSIPIKQIFSLEYFTDNTSDTITGYRPDGSIFYGPVTNLQINEKTDLYGLQSSSPPGLYTLSLLHNETEYYNDTITMISKNEYVYFEANKYETGDTITIYSYVTDSRQQVRLSDSSGQAVITWTSANEYIIPNAPTVLYFSLIDNNEYGQDIETSLDTGSIRAGNWKIEIVDTDGQPLTNESTYDYTTVSIRIDEPADASNEIIKTFFSLEGLFLIFTVCLTMMGLAVAKHPAGGGAGAVVGVGFGVYFGALPVWMLLLMVIALVVLAGVTVAVYFKGPT